MSARPRALYTASLAMVTAGAVRQLISPRAHAAALGWRPSPWFQRQIAALELAHVYGLAMLIRDPSESLYARVASLSALMIGINHAAAIASGNRAGSLNWVDAAGALFVGAAGLNETRLSARCS